MLIHFCEYVSGVDVSLWSCTRSCNRNKENSKAPLENKVHDLSSLATAALGQRVVQSLVKGKV